MQVAGKDSRPVGSFKNHGAGAITEQYTGGAVGEIEDAREHLGAEHQSLVRRTGLDHGIGDGECVDKAAANRLYIERSAAAGAQLVLQNTRRGREDHVRRGRGNDDEVDLFCL